MWELDCEENWALKIDAFELWCWRRLLRVPWTARRSNQSILKEISVHWKDWCWSWNSSTLANLMRRVDSLEKTLMLGGIGDRMRRGQQRMRWLDGITDSMGMGLGRRWELVIGRPGVLPFKGSQRVRHDWVTELNIFWKIFLLSLLFSLWKL